MLSFFRNTCFFNILALFTFFIAIASSFMEGPWQTLFGAFFFTLLFVLIIVISFRSISWYKKNLTSRIEGYRNWDEEGAQNYKAIATIESMNKNSKLEIIGRTCVRWLCADDEEDTKDLTSTKYLQNQHNRHQLIKQAIRRGSSIHFIIQNPKISIPYLSREDKEKIHSHAQAAIKSYQDLSLNFTQDEKDRCTLSITNEIIENSMVRLQEGYQIKRLIFDLNINFKYSSKLRKKTSTPFFVLEGNIPKKVNEVFDNMFDPIKKDAVLLDYYIKNIEEGVKQIDGLIGKYPHYSNLRKDQSKDLSIAYAQHYIANKPNSLVDRISAPVSIHILLTNSCSTQCKMCDHYKLSGGDELEKETWKGIFDQIRDLGTKSIILSGGEPLMYTGLYELLEYGKSKDLNIGLLTNGVNINGESISQENARLINKTCSWIQLSIDSFDPNTYQIIRGKRYLDSAVSSLVEIANSVGQANRLEICYTIQKDNIHEVPVNLNTLMLGSTIPGWIPIRYKFAHGPKNGKDFLCTEKQIDDLFERLGKKKTDDSNPCNMNYMTSMKNKKYFNEDDLAKGMPLKSKMIGYAGKKYKCRILGLTCTIDAEGDVYPCCFLYDDNHAKSKIRRQYCLGSLKKDSISHIWLNTRLKELIDKPLPVDEDACNFCTRHFYQNEFLNELNEILDKYPGIAEKYIENCTKEHLFFL